MMMMLPDDVALFDAFYYITVCKFYCIDKSSLKYYLVVTRISIQSISIADYACILKNKRGNVVDSI